MNHVNLRCALGAASLLVAAASPAAVASFVDYTQPEEELPSGWDVIDRSIEVRGGVERYMELKTIVSTGTFDMPAMGITGGAMRRVEAAPNSQRVTIELGGMGTMVQCTDGETAWMIPPGQDVVMELPGEQAEDLIRGAAFYANVQPRERYTEVKNEGIEAVSERDCYRVSLVANNGDISVGFYDVETGRRVKTMRRESAEIEVYSDETIFSDFREVDGIFHPFKIFQKNAGGEFTITITSIEHNVELPADEFDKPGEI